MSQQTPINTIIHGDALAILQTFPDNVIQTCITSPPYYGLRDYNTETILQLGSDPQDCQHEWIHEGRNELGHKVAQCRLCSAAKVDQQIGLEETPEAYVEKLVQVFREVRRVLRDDGTCWINLGDSYAGGGTHSTGRNDENTADLERRAALYQTGRIKATTTPQLRSTITVNHGLKPKDLIGIPWMVAFALRSDGWYLRSDVIWHKPTAMPESVTDRPTTAHEHIFLLAKSERYYYDADAIKELSSSDHPSGNGFKRNARLSYLNSDGTARGNDEQWMVTPYRNKRTVWTIATMPYSEAHFATFPPKLIEPCILAGTSPRACEHCGAPWERVTERVDTGWNGSRYGERVVAASGGAKAGGTAQSTLGSSHGQLTGKRHTTNWQPTCTCTNEGTGTCVVLDPFCGAGTVALVAIQHGRRYLGIELNAAYIAMAMKRIATVPQNLWSMGESEVAV
jgi:DNA modification methylase